MGRARRQTLNGSSALRDTENLPLREITELDRKLPREEFKAREEEYMQEINRAMDDSMFMLAASPESWSAMLRLYGQAPEYSIRNMLSAREQLKRKGVSAEGRILSPQKWEKLGRRIKEENSPTWGKGNSGDNVRDYGYDANREWDDTFTAEVQVPIWSEGYDVIDRYERNPHTGEIEKREQKIPRAGYRMMRVYHEGATEARDGGTPPPLPDEDVPRGHPGDILSPVSDALEEIGFEVQAVHGLPDEPAAQKRGQTVILNRSAPREQQALQIVEILAGEYETVDDTPEGQLIRDATRASVAYAICSAYDLETEQEFPRLEEIAENPEALSKIASEIHYQTTKLLKILDRRMIVKR